MYRFVGFFGLIVGSIVFSVEGYCLREAARPLLESRKKIQRGAELVKELFRAKGPEDARNSFQRMVSAGESYVAPLVEETFNAYVPDSDYGLKRPFLWEFIEKALFLYPEKSMDVISSSKYWIGKKKDCFVDLFFRLALEYPKVFLSIAFQKFWDAPPEFRFQTISFLRGLEGVLNTPCASVVVAGVFDPFGDKEVPICSTSASAIQCLGNNPPIGDKILKSLLSNAPKWVLERFVLVYPPGSFPRKVPGVLDFLGGWERAAWMFFSFGSRFQEALLEALVEGNDKMEVLEFLKAIKPKISGLSPEARGLIYDLSRTYSDLRPSFFFELAIDGLADPSEKVRAKAARELEGFLFDKNLRQKAFQMLKVAFADHSPLVRAQVWAGFGFAGIKNGPLGKRKLLDLAVRFFPGEDLLVQREILKIADRFGSEGFPIFITAFRSTRRMTRLEGLWTFGRKALSEGKKVKATKDLVRAILEIIENREFGERDNGWACLFAIGNLKDLVDRKSLEELMLKEEWEDTKTFAKKVIENAYGE